MRRHPQLASGIIGFTVTVLAILTHASLIGAPIIA